MAINTETSNSYKTLYPDSTVADPSKATQFLVDFAAGGPITVVMIPAEGQGGRGQTFDTSNPKSVSAMKSFIAAYEKQPFQVFWMPNRAVDNYSTPLPGREHIIEIRGVVLDFDPDKTVPLEDERLRLREVLDNMLGTEICTPFACVDSGGGMQMVFKLRTPVVVPSEDRDDAVAKYEGLVKALARSFGADTKTWRISNLFRVPFTNNWPNAAKKNAGRVRTVSGLWSQGGPTTSLTELRRLCVIRPEDLAKPATDASIDLDGLVEAELVHVLGKPKNLPDHIQTLLRSTPALQTAMKRPVDPGDMSRWDHSLCMSMARLKVPPQDMALILSAYGAKVPRTFKEKRLFSYIAQTVSEALQKVAVEMGFESPADARAAEQAHLDAIHALTVDEAITGIFDDAEIGVIEGLFPSQGMFVVYGASGSGKTFITLDLAYRVSLGLQWDSRRVTQGAVVYVAAESPRSVRRRMKALVDLHGNSADFFLVPAVVNMFDGKGDLSKLKAVLDKIGKPIRMVVFDTLARVMAPGNENTAQDMSTLVKNGDDLRDRYHTLVGWVHHSGKDVAAGARGSSALRAATDTEIEISDSKLLDVTKLRDGDQFERGFALKSVDIGALKDGTVVSTCVVAWGGSTTDRAKDPSTKARERIIAALEYLKAPSTVRDIADACRYLGGGRLLSKGHIRNTIAKAIEKESYFQKYGKDEKGDDLYGLLI